MVRTALLTSLLITPVSGAFAPLLSAAALAVPTAALSLDHSLPAGACCTTYYPFVLLTAVVAGPIYASLVGIGSVGLADALFMSPHHRLFDSPMGHFGDVASLLSFGLIIACVVLYRWVIRRRAEPLVCARSRSGIIFSLEKGIASASLPGSGPVSLGPQDEVAEMMRDFLAQLDLAERLSKR